mgnify:CR=1 FL=1
MSWLTELYQNLAQEGGNLSILEIIAVISSLIYVYLAAKTNRICFFFGGLSSAIYVYICFNYQLYFDTFLNVFYIITSFIGFLAWNKPKSDQAIQFLSPKSFLWISIVGLIVVLVSGYIVGSYSDASLPYIDSLTTIFALIGTVMVIKKYIENWIIWIIVDAISVGLYFFKELYFTSLLFLLFTIIAVKGYLEWKKQIN